MSREIVEAMRVLEQEKGIAPDTLKSALEDALLSAYKKSPGSAKYARVDLDDVEGEYRVFELILPPELEEKLVAEAREQMEEEELQPTIDPETGEPREPEDPDLDPEMLAPYEDQIESVDVTPDGFGRIAAQTAKQVMLQRIREAERQMMFEEYQDRVGELVTGIIQQSDNRYTLVQLRERVEALLPRSEQVWNERYDHGSRIRVVVSDVSSEGKGPSIVVSRRNPELIKSLFELEVPEIADKLVEIVGVAREPGYRSKIAVVSHADGVDPVGACVGPRGSRVRMVVSELRGPSCSTPQARRGEAAPCVRRPDGRPQRLEELPPLGLARRARPAAAAHENLRRQRRQGRPPLGAARPHDRTAQLRLPRQPPRLRERHHAKAQIQPRPVLLRRRRRPRSRHGGRAARAARPGEGGLNAGRRPRGTHVAAGVGWRNAALMSAQPPADRTVMETMQCHELTLEQMREIVRLRLRHPQAEVVVHPKPWGIVVEARRSGHAVELERFDWSGAVTPDQPIALAA